jgi:hypothetical protein
MVSIVAAVRVWSASDERLTKLLDRLEKGPDSLCRLLLLAFLMSDRVVVLDEVLVHRLVLDVERSQWTLQVDEERQANVSEKPLEKRSG